MSDGGYKNSLGGSNVLQAVMDGNFPEADITTWAAEFMERIFAASKANPMLLGQSLGDFHGFLEENSGFLAAHCCFTQPHLMFLTSLASLCLPEFAMGLWSVLQVASTNREVAHRLIEFDLIEVCVTHLRARSLSPQALSSLFLTWYHLCDVACDEEPELLLLFPFDVLRNCSGECNDLIMLVCIAKHSADPNVAENLCQYLIDHPPSEGSSGRFAWILFEIVRRNPDNLVFVFDHPCVSPGFVERNLFFKLQTFASRADRDFLRPYAQFLYLAARSAQAGTQLFDCLVSRVDLLFLMEKAKSTPEIAGCVVGLIHILFRRGSLCLEPFLSEDTLLILRELMMVGSHRTRIDVIRFLAEEEVVRSVSVTSLIHFSGDDVIDVYVDAMETGDNSEMVVKFLAALLRRLGVFRDIYDQMLGHLYETGFLDRLADCTSGTESQIPGALAAADFLREEIRSIMAQSA